MTLLTRSQRFWVPPQLRNFGPEAGGAALKEMAMFPLDMVEEAVAHAAKYQPSRRECGQGDSG